MKMNARLKPSRLRSHANPASDGEARQSAKGATAARYIVLTLLFAPACSGGSGGIGAVSCGASTPVVIAPPLHVPIGQLPAIDTNALLEHVKVLSSDEFEGRAPGTKGEELSVNYIADQFKKAGLKPGNPDGGTYFQK